MTIEHNAPDLRCDVCGRSVETIHDGDTFVAWERGWGRSNVATPCRPSEWPEDQRAEYERVQSLLGHNASLICDDHIGMHMCGQCITGNGIDLASDWPLIGCSARHAPEADR